MILSRKQAEDILKGFDENKDAKLAHVFDVANGSGIGCDTFAQFTKTVITKSGLHTIEVCMIDITDVGTW